MDPTLVILAAGAGTRYRGLKQLASVGPHGETLLEYSAFDALRAGFGGVVLVVGEETESLFRERLDSRMGRRVPVTYVRQILGEGSAAGGRTKPWGTGHAVLAVEAAVRGPFAVVNADDFYGSAAFVTLAEFLSKPQAGRRLAAVGYRLGETLPDSGAVSRAVLDVDDEGQMRHIVEILEVWRQGDRILHRPVEGREHALVGDELVSMNMWGFVPELLPELRRRFSEFVERFGGDPAAEFRLPDVIQILVAQGLFTVEVLPGGGEWCGMTFRRDREGVRSIVGSMIAQGRYPRDLWA